MTNRCGFTLVTLLVYILLNSMIIGVIVHAAVFSIFPSFRSLRETKERLSLYSALDVLVKDIRMSTVFKCKEAMPDSLMWNNGKADVCWRHNREQATIERIQGIYEHDKWKKRKTSVVATAIEKFVFEYMYKEGKVKGIECMLKNTLCCEKAVRGYVAVRG